MIRHTLSPDGLRLRLLAAIAASLGCAEDVAAPGDAAAPVRGLVACVPDEDLGYPGSGVVRCTGAFLHREQALECRPELLRVGAPGYPQSPPPSSSCFTNEDCRQLPAGACVLLGERLVCAYGCWQDSDCASNQLCLCTEGRLAGTCVAAECQTDADCPAGSLCTGPRDLSGLVRREATVPVHFACQSASDECAGDCLGGPCHYLPELGHRACGGFGAVPGRPFLIAGRARTAPVTASHGWLEANAGAPTAAAPALSAAERERVVAHWRHVGQLEHASVAAFARFTLQLLSLGAPAHLLAAAAQAQQDELRHAQAAFRLASHFSGGALGPGPLALSGLACGEPLEEIVIGTFLEGCVGETIAALEAAEALARAEHPLVRGALAGVAHDEARHAELAWCFVAWALEASGGRLLPALRAACHAARAEPAVAAASDGRLASYGVLASAELARVRREAWSSVIEPCLAALAARLPAACSGAASGCAAADPGGQAA